MVTSAYPSSEDPLKGTIISSFAEALVQKGIHVDMVVPHTSGNHPDSYCYNGVQVWRYHYFFPHSLEFLTDGVGIYYQFKIGILAKIQLPLLLLFEIFTLLLVVKKIKPDVIHTHWIIPHGFIGAIVHQLTDIPHIISIHGSDINIVTRNPIFNVILPFIKKNSQYITTNSKFTLEKTCSTITFIGCNMKVIPMGMGCQLNQNGSTLLKVEKIYNIQKKILFVGRLIEWKGVKILISAYKHVKKELPNTQLIIVGDGPDYKGLLDYTNKLEIQDSVQFKGYVKDDELQIYYQTSDIFVLPSYPIENQTEGLGVVLLEAMTAGVPVIGSDTGGIPDIIEDGVNGLLVPPGDEKMLAEAIKKLIQNPDLAEQFRREGFKTVQMKYSWEIITDAFIKTYNEVNKKMA